jgi:hypothetical protein
VTPCEAPVKLSKRVRKDVEQVQSDEVDLQKMLEMAVKDQEASQATYDVICSRMAAKARRLQGERFAILAEEGRAATRRRHHGGRLRCV